MSNWRKESEKEYSQQAIKILEGRDAKSLKKRFPVDILLYVVTPLCKSPWSAVSNEIGFESPGRGVNP